MKAKRRSSSAKRWKAKRSAAPKRKSKASKRTSKGTRRSSAPRGIAQLGPPPAPPEPDYATCQEPEVGDIGGFGDVQAFESHEKMCGERATEMCQSCGRNLCSNHYQLMHREHDRTSAQATNL